MNVNFDEHFINTLNRNLRIADSAPDKELEIRFSTFQLDNLIPRDTPAIPNYKPSKYKFVPVLERAVFHRARDTFGTYGLQTEYEESHDNIYGDIHRNVIILGPNGETIKNYWVYKERTYTYDVFEYNMRLCMSYEKPIDPSDPILHTLPVKMSRHKRRWSFYDKCVRYDFTEISTRTPNHETVKDSFELEIEYIGNKNPAEIRVPLDKRRDHILYCISHLLSILQDVLPGALPMTISEKHNVLLEYAVLSDLLKNPKTFFIGAQPETLHRHHLRLIKSGYAVTEKYDGERGLLFVNDASGVFIIDRRLRVRSTGATSTAKGTLLDVEVMNGVIYAFDVLFNEGEDLRGKREFPLTKRLDLIKGLLPKIPGLKLKPYHMGSFNGLFNAKKPSEHPSDGYIFVPLDEAYPIRAKWATLLKWKPNDLNTIDFSVQKSQNYGSTETWNLLVTDTTGSLVPFEKLPSTQVDVSVGAPFLDGSIVECGWDVERKQLLPIKTREDKNRPNFKAVALDIWQSIHEPVSIKDLQSLATSPFECMRKFHNKIKAYTIDKSFEFVMARQNADYKLNVLDLACGRGGDITKWRKHGKHIRYWCGIDNDVKLLQEASDRAKACSNFEYTLAEYDLTQEEPTEEALLQPRFDIVSCQFALHYFYETEETWNLFTRVLLNRLIPGGFFICTLFDAYKVYETLVTGLVPRTKAFTLKSVFDIRNGIGMLKKKQYGNEIIVSIDEDPDVILNSPRKEYLIFADTLVSQMEAIGLHLVETHLFHDVPFRKEYSMDTVESCYSDLGRYYIFQYNPVRKTVPQFSKISVKDLFWGIVDMHPTVEDPITVYKSRPMDLLNSLSLVTGRLIPDISQNDYNAIAEYYNLFIGVIADNLTFELFKPDVYFEDIRMVWISKDKSGVHFWAFKKLRQDICIVFPSGKYSVNTEHPDYVTVTTVSEELAQLSVEDNKEESQEFTMPKTYMGRALDRSKGAWTVKELADLCKQRDIKTPVKKKDAYVKALLDFDALQTVVAIH